MGKRQEHNYHNIILKSILEGQWYAIGRYGVHGNDNAQIQFPYSVMNTITCSCEVHHMQ